MSVAQQAIARRRAAKIDERYKYKHTDSATRARRLAEQIKRENEMRIRRGIKNSKKGK